MVGLAKPKFYDWKKRSNQKNLHNGKTPKDTWIHGDERRAIIDYFAKHPLNGCRRLSFMMIDANVVYVSPNTVYRVLKSEGLIDKKNRGTSQKGTGFDQPSKPHEQWHIDISYINAGGTFYYLCSILDGYSRYIVHWDIKEAMKEDQVEIIVQQALEKFQNTGPRLISDNGPQFRAKEFKVFIKLSGMDQTFTSPYYPQSNGKIERWHKTLKKTCIRPKQPKDLESARKYITEFIDQYNNVRLHGATGYITPKDMLDGKEVKIKEERTAKLKQARDERKRKWHDLKNRAEKEIALAKTA